MTAEGERRTLQICVSIACFVPLAAGGGGVFESVAGLRGVDNPIPIDLDSHFRYLSGLLLGIGIGFALCIPRIEQNGAVFRTLGLVVFIGGLSRLLSLAQMGMPGGGHQFGLVMELIVVPLLVLWQARVARRSTA
jgi:hypothetical protein